MAFHRGEDHGLAALYFQFGRYLLISCSRPGGQPATLQGLWNDSMNPPWQSKYTVNINTEMNYWLANVANLAECEVPLVALIADLAVTGRETARNQYGARGWVCHHNTDLWRGTAPVDWAEPGMWQTGGAWLALHLWERFQFQEDLEELRANFHLLQGAAEFFLDALFELGQSEGQQVDGLNKLKRHALPLLLPHHRSLKLHFDPPLALSLR
jgi:alpha-L-fucosidase 2